MSQTSPHHTIEGPEKFHAGLFPETVDANSHRCESGAADRPPFKGPGSGYFFERPLLPAAPKETMPNR